MAQRAKRVSIPKEKFLVEAGYTINTRSDEVGIFYWISKEKGNTLEILRRKDKYGGGVCIELLGETFYYKKLKIKIEKGQLKGYDGKEEVLTF